MNEENEELTSPIEPVVSGDLLTGEYHTDVNMLIDKIDWISSWLCANAIFAEFKEVLEWGKEADKIVKLKSC